MRLENHTKRPALSGSETCVLCALMKPRTSANVGGSKPRDRAVGACKFHDTQVGDRRYVQYSPSPYAALGLVRRMRKNSQIINYV